MAFFALLATRRDSMDFWPKLTAGREWLLLGLYFDRLNYPVLADSCRWRRYSRCRPTAVSGDRPYMDAPTLPSFQFMRADRIRLQPYIRTFAAA
jgi:hypothetical protein